MGLILPCSIISLGERNDKDTHRKKPENYFFGLLVIMGDLLIHTKKTGTASKIKFTMPLS
jgi:hypothetical protein